MLNASVSEFKLSCQNCASSSRVQWMTCIFFCRNLDIRDAILQMLNVIRDGNKKGERDAKLNRELAEDIKEKVKGIRSESGGGGGGAEKKIDNISTFLLRSVFRLKLFI